MTAARFSASSFLLLLGCAASLYIASLSSTVGHSIDDGIHIVAAKALATGQGLRMISDPAAPPATQFPPGQSLCLALVLLFFPDPPANIIPLQLVSTVFALGFVALCWVWFHRRCAFPVAMWLTALVAVHPETVRFAGAVMAEMGYAALAMATVLLFERAFRDDSAGVDRLALAGVPLVMTGAYLFRSVGLALILATLGVLALRRRWYLAVGVTAAFLLLASPWLFKSALVGTPEYRSQFWLISLEDPEQGEIDLPGLAGRMGQNGLTYLSETVPVHLVSVLGSRRLIQFFQEAGLYPALVVLRLGVSVLACLGFWRRLRAGMQMADLYMVIYFGMLLLWHNRLHWKYMAPVTPILLYYLWTGFTWTVDRFPKRVVSGALPYALLTVLLAGYGLRAADSVEAGWLVKGEDPYAPAYTWIKHRTPEDSLLIGFDHLGLFLYTGRKAVAPLMSHDPDAVLQYILDTGADYFVVQPRVVTNEGPSLDAQFQRPALERFPDRFSRMYADPEHGIEVYRINRGA